MVTIDPKTFEQWLAGHVDKLTELGRLARAYVRLGELVTEAPTHRRIMKSYNRYVSRHRARHGGPK